MKNVLKEFKQNILELDRLQEEEAKFQERIKSLDTEFRDIKDHTHLQSVNQGFIKLAGDLKPEYEAIGKIKESLYTIQNSLFQTINEKRNSKDAQHTAVLRNVLGYANYSAARAEKISKSYDKMVEIVTGGKRGFMYPPTREGLESALNITVGNNKLMIN